MITCKIKLFLPILLTGFIYLHGLAQPNTDRLIFRTSQGQQVTVYGGAISVNNKKLYIFQEDAILYESKRNRLIENSGSTFLFLEIDGSPNKDRFYVFKIFKDKVDSITDTISSEIRDLDGDSNLEFGGSDLTEMHPSKDSMYYIPSAYYEIKEGKIKYDSVLTKMIDIRINGIYLSNPMDAQGNCCKVIPKSKKKKVAKGGNPANFENRVIDTIANLKEVKKRASYLEDQTKGKRHLRYAIWGRPAKETPYYWIKVMEDNGDAYVTHFDFYLYPKTMTIKYSDPITGEVLDLNTWRERENNQPISVKP